MADILKMDTLTRSTSAAIAEMDTQGLFIVGHARSGTSILMDALNSSTDIYMFGEANLHVSANRNDFVEWYNSMHRQFGNPEYKGTYCPEGGNESANGIDTIVSLARRFKYVGDKLAFNSETFGLDFEGFLPFAAKYFLRSTYLCALRNPLQTISSCLDLFQSGERTQDTVDLYADSYLRSIYLQLRVSMLFNRTYFLVHDRITESTFETLSKYLDVDLAEAWLFYDEKHLHKAVRLVEDLQSFPSVQRVSAVYARLVEHLSAESLRPTSLWNLRTLMYELRNELVIETKAVS